MQTQSTIALIVNTVLTSSKRTRINNNSPVLVFNSNSGYVPNNVRRIISSVNHLSNNVISCYKKTQKKIN